MTAMTKKTKAASPAKAKAAAPRKTVAKKAAAPKAKAAAPKKTVAKKAAAPKAKAAAPKKTVAKKAAAPKAKAAAPKKTVAKKAAAPKAKAAAPKKTAPKKAAAPKAKAAAPKKTVAKRASALKSAPTMAASPALPAFAAPVLKPGLKLTPRQRRIQNIRERLLAQRDELIAEAETAKQAALPEQTVFPDLGDQASAETDRNFLLRLKGREQRLIKKIEETIERIDSGSYGVCDACGEEIGIARLEARPVTTMCIDCKTEQEEEEKLQSAS